MKRRRGLLLLFLLLLDAWRVDAFTGRLLHGNKNKNKDKNKKPDKNTYIEIPDHFVEYMMLLMALGHLSKVQKQKEAAEEFKKKMEELLKHKEPEKAESQHLVCYYRLEKNDSRRLQPEQIDDGLCTHLVLGYADVRYDVLVPRTEVDLDGYRRVTALKEKNAGLKVMLSVGARSRGRFAAMVATPLGRERFIYSAIYFLDKYKFDGIDFDWEFPAWNGAPPYDRINFVYFLEEFKHALKVTKKTLLLSAAVAAPIEIVRTSYDIHAIAKYLDFVNLMSYNFPPFHAEWPYTSHPSPLFARNKLVNNFYHRSVSYTASFWEVHGMPRSKIVVGVQMYGRTYKLAHPQANGLDAPASSPGLGHGKLTHTQVCHFLKTGANKVFDLTSKVPHAFRGRDWVGYENKDSVRHKAQWVKEFGFGGVMTYNLNSDDWSAACDNSTKFPLHKAIKETLSG